VAYLNSLDAMQMHITMYLLWDLRIPSHSIPALVPMIDTRWFEARLESEVGGVLKKLEDGERE
jgi:hypothetical protein